MGSIILASRNICGCGRGIHFREALFYLRKEWMLDLTLSLMDFLEGTSTG
jgi:hypothetical protein